MLDLCYPVPGITVLNKEFDMLMKELKGKIACCSSDARNINICTDIYGRKRYDIILFANLLLKEIITNIM